MSQKRTDAELLAAQPEFPCPVWAHTTTGNTYTVLCAAYQESDLSLQVVYVNAAGVRFIRPLDAFRQRFCPVTWAAPPMLTDAQRGELRRILMEEYRGTAMRGEPLKLDGVEKATLDAFHGGIKPKMAFRVPAPHDPATAFVGTLMANPGLAADVYGYLCDAFRTNYEHDGERGQRICAAVGRAAELPKGE